ncbi:MAG: hypothetical protein M0R66_04580 [Candidatus Omnitrophica bacterium]|nr:hypothetical protein [Candidatus Omnitrophota bacterium]
MRRLKGILFLLFLSIFSGMFMGSSLAIDMPRIDRSKIRLYIRPGFTESGKISIENPTGAVLSMRAYLGDWYYSNSDGSKEFIPPNTAAHSCANWVSFSPAEFNIGPFGREEINYTVKVPKETNGGYYAVLFFENMLAGASANFPDAVGVNLSVRFATLFYIEVRGTTERKAVLENIELKKAGPVAPLLVNADFKNTGNVDIISSGVFAVMDKKSRVAARGTFNDVYTLPGDKVKLKGIYRETLESGIYNLIITLDLSKTEYRWIPNQGTFLVKEVEFEVGADGTLANFNVAR